MAKFFILTDLEGVVGVDSFTQTRTSDGYPERIDKARKRLAAEVNACVEGIRQAIPDAQIDVWDGHGPGGLYKEDLVGANYLREGQPYKELQGYDALLFVGQHAMAGTIHAPLNHTYSSLSVDYYKLNGVFIGEFGARALIAGRQGVPTIFLSGDDKAALEARMFVPNIETVIVKRGTGIESAVHLDGEEALSLIRQGAARALERMKDIPPFTGIASPYVLEMCFRQPLNTDRFNDFQKELLNDRTIRLYAVDLSSFPL